MSGETTVKCPICGDPYKVFLFSAADQSACQECVKRAEHKLGRRPASWPK